VYTKGNHMLIGILTFLSAISISAVAIYYSVAGLVAIFAAAAVPIIIMGGVLEVGKLVTAVWLHRYWSQAAWWLKSYLSIAVLVLMFITSMGIFGFLSKAHIEQTSAGQESVAQVERLTNEIQRQQDIIDRAEEKIKKLETSTTGGDANIQAQIDSEQSRIDKAYERIEPAIAEQQAIIDKQADLYKKELAKIDGDLATLQGYIDSGETKKAQQMIGASADGIFGKKTADKIGDWQDEKQAKRIELITKIEEASNNPQAQAAAQEIKRLRKTVETQIVQSNELINRLRDQLGDTDKSDNIDAQVDAQNTRIKNANAEIDILTDEKYALEGEYRKLEAEVGPIKYIAEFVYGEAADKSMLEEAVRWVIIIIIFVFDPLAVLLLIASQYTFHWVHSGNVGGGGRPKSDEDDPQDDPQFEDVSPEELAEEERREYEHARAQAIAKNVPTGFEELAEDPIKSKHSDQFLLFPDIDPEEFKSEEIKDEDDPIVAGTEEEQLELDFDKKPSRADINKEMVETDDLTNWNDWVEKANEEAEKNPEIPNTRNRIFYSAELEDQKKTSYITKVENKQIRKKTKDSDQTSQK